MKHAFKSHRDDDGGPFVPCAICFVERHLHPSSQDPIDPALLKEAYENVMLLADTERPSDTRWQAIASFYDRLVAQRESVG